MAAGSGHQKLNLRSAAAQSAVAVPESARHTAAPGAGGAPSTDTRQSSVVLLAEVPGTDGMVLAMGPSPPAPTDLWRTRLEESSN